MTKYAPLQAFLAGRTDLELPMTFQEIEQVIGASLPPVAFKHRAWWSNNPSNSVITDAWLAAGYKSERVDMGSQKLVFRRTRDLTELQPPHGGVSEPPAQFSAKQSSAPGSVLTRVRKALGGTVRIAPGYDLTKPTGEIWDAGRG